MSTEHSRAVSTEHTAVNTDCSTLNGGECNVISSDCSTVCTECTSLSTECSTVIVMAMCVNVTGQGSLEDHRAPSAGSRRSVSSHRTWT